MFGYDLERNINSEISRALERIDTLPRRTFSCAIRIDSDRLRNWMVGKETKMEGRESEGFEN